MLAAKGRSRRLYPHNQKDGKSLIFDNFATIISSLKQAQNNKKHRNKCLQKHRNNFSKIDTVKSVLSTAAQRVQYGTKTLVHQCFGGNEEEIHRP